MGRSVSHPCGISSRVGGTGPGTPLPPAIRCRSPWMRAILGQQGSPPCLQWRSP